MKDDWVILRLPPDLLASLRVLAGEAKVSPGQYLRDYVARSADAANRPNPVPKPEGPATAMLRELIQDILFRADTWGALQNALLAEGFALKPEGYGLVVTAWPSDEKICKSSALGFSYAELIRRLGPGEPPAPDKAPANTEHAPARHLATA